MFNFFTKDGYVIAVFYADEITEGDGEDTRVDTLVVGEMEESPREE